MERIEDKDFEGRKRKADNELNLGENKNTHENKNENLNEKENFSKGKGKKSRKEKNEELEKQRREKRKQEWVSNANNTELTGKSFDPKLHFKNEKFEFYYRTQLAPYFENEEQFQFFVDKMKEKLPCVFRINTANPFWERFREMLRDENFMKELFHGQDFGIKISPKRLTNSVFWRDLVYNINIPRFELKKNENLSKFHKLIQMSVDAGLASRQEAVSMIPPMLMDVNYNDRIFDMCAAPGSKTAQFLEVFYRNYDLIDPKSIERDTGFVLANDNNHNRAHMMTHQLKRLNTAGMVVISHDAQFFPTIYEETEERLLFDKILADVPCSSDAVMRKLPHKWRNWTPRDSLSLHKLQLQIIKRGISLLKVGGTIVYSTCSLNPIENEAVVSEVMRTYGNNLEVVDLRSAFEGSDIKCHPGLLTWKVYIDDKLNKNNNNLLEIKNKDDPEYQNYKDLIDESCFPSDQKTNKNLFKLQNCIRLFPHDSDTSGFFITVFKKISPLTYGSDKHRGERKPVNPTKEISFVHEANPEIVNWIGDYYGLNGGDFNHSKFPLNQLVTHSKITKKINFISRGVAHLINSDKRNQLKLINMGVKLFSSNKKKSQEENVDYCKYRICQDGLMYVLPFMTKRIFFCKVDFFVKLLKEVDVKQEDVDDVELRESLAAVKSGCVVIMCVKEKPDFEKIKENFQTKYLEYLRENYVDAICGYTSPVKVSTMINKEHQHVFNLKFNITQK